MCEKRELRRSNKWHHFLFYFFGVGKGLLGWLIIQRGRHRLNYIEKGISKENRLNVSHAH